MRYIDFLAALHRNLEPETYVEIGVRIGGSLAVSRTHSVGIDPAFSIRHEIDCDVHLFRATSDDYFARPDALADFDGKPIGLSFIDGMHLYEFALRDFTYVERHSAWWTVAVFDDVCPRAPVEANRDRTTRGWTGDVFKNIPILQQWRPDLMVLPIHTAPTGLLLVLGLDASNTTLVDNYDAIIQEYDRPDPQQVPDEIMSRSACWSAEVLADSGLWAFLKEAKEQNMPAEVGLPKLRELVSSLQDSAKPDFEADPIMVHNARPWPTPRGDETGAVPPSSAERPPTKKRAWRRR